MTATEVSAARRVAARAIMVVSVTALGSAWVFGLTLGVPSLLVDTFGLATRGPYAYLLHVAGGVIGAAGLAALKKAQVPARLERRLLGQPPAPEPPPDSVPPDRAGALPPPDPAIEHRVELIERRRRLVRRIELPVFGLLAAADLAVGYQDFAGAEVRPASAALYLATVVVVVSLALYDIVVLSRRLGAARREEVAGFFGMVGVPTRDLARVAVLEAWRNWILVAWVLSIPTAVVGLIFIRPWATDRFGPTRVADALIIWLPWTVLFLGFQVAAFLHWRVMRLHRRIESDLAGAHPRRGPAE